MSTAVKIKESLKSRFPARQKGISVRACVSKTPKKKLRKKISPVKTLHCPKCKTDKPISEFYTNGICKPCQRSYELTRRKKNPKKFRAYRRRAYHAQKNRGQLFLQLN
jgi:hypothetical protein